VCVCLYASVCARVRMVIVEARPVTSVTTAAAFEQFGTIWQERIVMERKRGEES